MVFGGVQLFLVFFGENFSRSGRLAKDYNSGSLNETVSSCIEASWGLLALRVN